MTCPALLVPHRARVSLLVTGRLSRGIFCGPPSLSNLQGCGLFFLSWTDAVIHVNLPRQDSIFRCLANPHIRDYRIGTIQGWAMGQDAGVDVDVHQGQRMKRKGALNDEGASELPGSAMIHRPLFLNIAVSLIKHHVEILL